jgi:23S rRNA-/tRNA-specific pseudouridylate synthase
MASNLVPAAGLGSQLEQRVAAGRVAIDGMGQLGDGQAPVAGHGGLRLVTCVRGRSGLEAVAPAREGMVDHARVGRMATLLELGPETGRRHQIRRHLKYLSHPVIGDATYGKGPHNRLFARLFDSHRLLHACVELRLTHPVTGDPLVLKAPPADDFARVAAALGWSGALDDLWPGGRHFL